MDNHTSARTNPQNSRPTIGLLTYSIRSPIAQDLWAGVSDAAREQDVNLLCIAGGVLELGLYFQSQANVLYDLVNAENVDGLVIWGGTLAYQVGGEGLETFCEQYRPLPMVSVSLPLEGIPSVMVDNYQGMHDAVCHMIEVHGYRRIAFIRGPQGHLEADARYRAYTDALAEHDIPLDTDLVAPSNLLFDGGEAAIDLLFEKLLPQTGIEAVVAVTDGAALGALTALQARGIRVPDDIAIVGFDDIQKAKHFVPSLTTVQQSQWEIGKRAVEMLMAQLRGERAPERVTVPSKLIVRQSCGCLPTRVLQAATGKILAPPASESFEAAFAARREEIVSDMMQALLANSDEGQSSAGMDSELAEQLLDGFVAELGRAEQGTSQNALLSALGGILRQTVAAGGDVAAWQGALSTLRRHAIACLGPGDAELLSRAEDPWGQCRVMIGEMGQQAQSHKKFQTEQRMIVLREVGQALITTFDVVELMDVLAQGLPSLGIPGCYLSLYEGQEMPAATSRLILGYDKEGRVKLEAGGRRFPTHQLIPGGMSSREKRYSVVVEALYFRDEQLGFVSFDEGTRDGLVYDVLRAEISSALKGALLLQERKQVEQEMQRRLQEQMMLFDVSRSLSGALRRPEEIAKIVIRQFVEVMGVDESSLSLLNAQGDALEVLTSFFLDDERHAHYVEYGPEVDYLADYPATARVMETLQPRVVHAGDAHADPAEAVYMEEFDIATLVVLPLAFKGQAIGIIEIEMYGQKRHFDEQEIGLAMTLSSQAATAMENARLYEEVQQAHAEVESQVVARTAELEREVAERERTAQSYQQLVENSLQGISVVQDMKIAFANQAVADMWGYTVDELLALSPKECLDIVHPDDQEMLTKFGQDRMAGKPVPNQYEYRFVRKDGSTGWAEIMITAVEYEGRPASQSIEIDITERRLAEAESARLQQEVTEAHKRAIQELSTPIIPIMDRILVMPLVGSIDSMRARDITRALLEGINAHRAKVVILDITGVSVVDSGVANHLNKTIQAARLKGARTIITGISDEVAETIVDLGIDWTGIDTLNDLQTGLVVALNSLGIKLSKV